MCVCVCIQEGGRLMYMYLYETTVIAGKFDKKLTKKFDKNLTRNLAIAKYMYTCKPPNLPMDSPKSGKDVLLDILLGGRVLTRPS